MKRKWLHKLVWLLVAACLVGLTALLVLTCALPTIANRIIARELHKRGLDDHVALKITGISPSGLTAGPLVIRDATGEVRVEAIHVRWSPDGLRNGTIDGLSVHSIRATVEERDGQWQLLGTDRLLKLITPPNGTESVPAGSSSASPPAFACSAIAVRDALLTIRSPTGAFRVPIEVTASLDQDANVKGKLTLTPCGETVQLSLEGNVASGTLKVTVDAERLRPDRLSDLTQTLVPALAQSVPLPHGELDVHAEARLADRAFAGATAEVTGAGLAVVTPWIEVAVEKAHLRAVVPSDWRSATATADVSLHELHYQDGTLAPATIEARLEPGKATVDVAPTRVRWGDTAATLAMQAEARLDSSFSVETLNANARLTDGVLGDQELGSLVLQVTGTTEQLDITVKGTPTGVLEGFSDLRGTGSIRLDSGMAANLSGQVNILPSALARLAVPDQTLDWANAPVSVRVDVDVSGDAAETCRFSADAFLAESAIAVQWGKDAKASLKVSGQAHLEGTPDNAAFDATLDLVHGEASMQGVRVECPQAHLEARAEHLSADADLGDLTLACHGTLGLTTVALDVPEGIRLKASIAGEFRTSGTLRHAALTATAKFADLAMETPQFDVSSAGGNLTFTARQLPFLDMPELLAVSSSTWWHWTPPAWLWQTGCAMELALCPPRGSVTESVSFGSASNQDGDEWTLTATFPVGGEQRVALGFEVPAIPVAITLPEVGKLNATTGLSGKIELGRHRATAKLAAHCEEVHGTTDTANVTAQQLSLAATVSAADWSVFCVPWLRPPASAHHTAQAQANGTNPLVSAVFSTDHLRRQLSLDGHIAARNVNVEVPGRATVSGISLSLPIHVPPRSSAGEGAPPRTATEEGHFTALRILAGKHELGRVDGTCCIVGDTVQLKGTFLSETPPATVTFSGGGDYLPPFHGQAHLTLEPLQITDLEAFKRMLPDLDGLDFSGTISATAQMRHTGDTTKGSATLSLSDGVFAMPEEKLTVKGIQAALLLDDLPRLRTAPHQKIAFESLQLDQATLGGGEITYHVQSPNAVFLERCRLDWLGGRLVTHAVSFDPQKPDFSVTVFFDSIALSEMAPLLGSVAGKAQGTLYGKLPISVHGGRISYEDGFLYSVPGETGTLQLAEAGLLTTGVPETAPNYKELKLAEEALQDFQFSLFRLDLEAREPGEHQLRLRLEGRSASDPEIPPVHLNVNVNGALEEYINMGLRMSGH